MVVPVEWSAVDPHSTRPQNAPDSGDILSAVVVVVVSVARGRAKQKGQGCVKLLTMMLLCARWLVNKRLYPQLQHLRETT